MAGVAPIANTRIVSSSRRALVSPPALTPMTGLAQNRPMDQQNFERVLSSEPFKGLQAILNSVAPNRALLCEAVNATNSYEELLTKLGYRITLTNQIHVQDCYQRVSQAGGIKAVLPYYDIPTHNSLPTLVNLDSTITTTPKSAAFFNQMLLALKRQLSAQN
jgi:hypothetical protein